VFVNPGLASASSQVQYDSAGAQAGPAGATSEGMYVRQFASEAYPRIVRGDAWRGVLAQLRLCPAPSEGDLETFATASLRGDPDGMVLGRLTAGSQILAPSAARSRVPIGLLPLDEDIEVEAINGPLWVPPGTLVLLAPDQEWRIVLNRTVQIVVLSLSDHVVKGRFAGWRAFDAPRRLQPEGFAGVFINLVETAAAEMDVLSTAEWRALEQGVADLFLTMVAGEGGPTASTAPSGVALFNRVTLAIERRLHDPRLTASRIARAEGISERYLQRLFEQNDVSFGHYLRDRRLERARAALVSPSDVRTPVADVAYRCGFGDAANFNRLFKERFGAPPGSFRSQHADGFAESGRAAQRGWPLSALANPKHKHRSVISETLAEDLADLHDRRDESTHHRLAVSSANVHWGYFSRSLRPVLEIRSGDSVEIETLTQHASDDPELMIRGDGAAEEVFLWTKDRKGVDRRGAGPLDASIFGRGAGEGFGVHICTGPISVKDAEPGDVIEVRIDDMTPRPSRSPGYEGRCFGSNVAAWWGYHYSELIEEPKPRENVTIYEIFAGGDEGYAQALYAYRWSPQVDPFGVLHQTYDYPGVPVDRSAVEICGASPSAVRIPLRPHFGVIAVAPREAGPVDSVPPAYFGGNLDNWRLGKGSAVYLPVSAPGGLLSIGDPHAAQGDGEIAGTAIECSMTGRFTIVLHKKGGRFAGLTYPLIETPTEWVLTGFSHPNYLAEFGSRGQGEVYVTSSLDLAMKDAFRKTRRFLMEMRGLNEDEAIAVMSAAVDFGVTQVVDGNWGVHAIVRKSLFKV
jgi:acetamidase/formamidase/AraC-like DNA-binding protein